MTKLFRYLREASLNNQTELFSEFLYFENLGISKEIILWKGHILRFSACDENQGVRGNSSGVSVEVEGELCQADVY
jgi:hypothetical protein